MLLLVLYLSVTFTCMNISKHKYIIQLLVYSHES
jgi:hypothetical protein